MANIAHLAWVVREYVNGRTQAHIADELGVAPSAISNRIKVFCEIYNGGARRLFWGARLDVEDQMIYAGPWDHARRALRNYKDEIIRPEPRPWGDPPPFSPSELSDARGEHAWLLRAEGLKLREIGERLGVCRERAKQIVDKQGRRVTRALRHIRLPMETSDGGC